MNHAAIGACVCERWNFSQAMTEAVRRHLEPPENLGGQSLPRVSLVVCALCRISRTALSPAELERWRQILNVTAEQMGTAQTEATSASLGALRDIFMGVPEL